MHADRLPVLVYGDGPRLPSGLGRIARDLTLRLFNEEEPLGITVAQVGVDPPDGWHHQAWPCFGFQPTMEDQGRSAIRLALQEYADSPFTPIIMMVMDPSRCYDLTRTDPREPEIPQRFWGYFPIDSENINGRLSGPAAEAVWSCNRVLAYGRYGAGVLERTLQAGLEARSGSMLQVGAVPSLPHGLDSHWAPTSLEEAAPQFRAWIQDLPLGAVVIGCVATNQPRKDLSLLFAVGALLRRTGQPVGIWLHTDRTSNAWDIGTLVGDFDFSRDEVCVSTAEHAISDLDLAARYTASTVTLAVGLGEGFGYPIVESLACGTPVVHGKFGGGVALIPRGDWLVDPAAWRLESCYAVKRPVLQPEQVMKVVQEAAAWKAQDLRLCQAYCRGSVSYLSWDSLWPRWRKWFRDGFQQERAHVQRRRR